MPQLLLRAININKLSCNSSAKSPRRTAVQFKMGEMGHLPTYLRDPQR
jgi:hypothetical protein